jgi:hypothetical protein
VFVLIAACKSDPHAAPDGGRLPPDAAPDAGAPPDASSACPRVGFSWLPWVATGHQPHGVVVADVDRDGIPDLVISVEGTKVGVLLGSGGGRFRPGGEYPIRTAAGFRLPVVADVNHDGKLDIVVAGSAVSVLLGNGDGTFGAETDFAFGGNAADFAAADVDHDGNLDVVVSRPAAGQVSVLLGRGDGTFGTAADYATVASPGRLAIADVSGDGKPDLVVGSSRAFAASVLRGNGDGTFGAHTEYATLLPVDALAVADVSGDGIADIVTVRNTDEELNMTMLIGQGDGSFPRRIDSHVERFPVSVDVIDVDRDGKPDIVTTDNDNAAVTVEFGEDGGVPSFGRYARYAVGAFPTAVVITDVSGDGRPDLVTANSGGDNVAIALGDGSGTFLDVPPHAGPSGFFFLADLDRDGKLDAVGAAAPANLTVQLGNGDGTFRAPALYPSNAPVTLAVPADVNHDGKLDIILQDHLPSPLIQTLSVRLGNGDGSFGAAVDQPVDPSILGFAAADLDSDGNADVVEIHAFPNLMRLRLGNGDGTFRAGMDYPLSESPGRVVAADLDRDGNQDLIVTFFSSVGVMLGNGDGTFRPRVDHATPIGVGMTTVADVNRDGKPDLLIVTGASSVDNTMTVLLGAGDGTFVTHGSYVTSVFGGVIAAGDVTGDGNPDAVLWSGASLAVSVLPGDGTGAFLPRTDYPATVTLDREVEVAIAVADVTSDGKPDIVVSGGPLFVASCAP